MNAPQHPQQPQHRPQQPGYGQPPAGPHPPPGHPLPSHPQPGGYGPPPPPRKKRTGLVIGIVVGVVVLVVAGVVGSMYLEYVDEPGGGPGAEPIAQCELSAELRSQAHVSSFRLVQAPTDAKKGMKQTHCAWEQTKGEDGRDPRRLSFLVYDFTTFSDKPDRNLDQARDNYASFTSYATGEQAKALGVGDESMILIPSSPADLTEVNLLVRKGTVVWNIRYQGHDKGFLADSDFPVADAEAVALKVAEEVTG
ncbi:hypothetical protein IOD16_33115 [Saccharothrix sp. 6-C]|uniref:hypothetical protein n=1 Tax=Saccharothrix sp. 6-C TaxID=2781735 RepID=UPI001916D748|nr:hypothetical protein [Saccharothrix sp. 6-C]QQQ75855.1 hypothetical protein IOD16_33115 [Saccharothrix sp. 6-C]